MKKIWPMIIPKNELKSHATVQNSHMYKKNEQDVKLNMPKGLMREHEHGDITDEEAKPET